MVVKRPLYGCSVGQNVLNHLKLARACAWTPTICNKIAFGAAFGGFGLSFYILMGVRIGAFCSCVGDQL